MNREQAHKMLDEILNREKEDPAGVVILVAKSANEEEIASGVMGDWNDLQLLTACVVTRNYMVNSDAVEILLEGETMELS